MQFSLLISHVYITAQHTLIFFVPDAQHNSWIGGTKDPLTGLWIWVTSNRTFDNTFDSWYPNEPSGNENCAILRGWLTAGWYDVSCEFTKPYFCEFFNDM